MILPNILPYLPQISEIVIGSAVQCIDPSRAPDLPLKYDKSLYIAGMADFQSCATARYGRGPPPVSKMGPLRDI